MTNFGECSKHPGQNMVNCPLCKADSINLTTMTQPEEKAKELIDKFQKVGCRSTPEAERNSAIQSAEICVNAIIEVQSDFYGLVLTEKFRDRCRGRVEYWGNVLNCLNSMK